MVTPVTLRVSILAKSKEKEPHACYRCGALTTQSYCSDECLAADFNEHLWEVVTSQS